ncbi:polysaccharide biosynthesis/export family protein [Hyphomicrobium facile]|uniref:Exopolysaccharide production protein ExoF n=1 Tax=Hyphomicrobium facile TaxID=51670 RepID=A0A1I7N645_9HYPH|nr:polysaccharide biosynthesis/export family protein [Hyphomicrobium facile]SFV30135.1 exopolysaccharide production protein ExoF [Hyphomicrobium facile]
MPNALIRALFGLTLFLIALPATPLFAADYTLDTGDKVRIAVHDWPDLSGEFNVTATGTIFLPLVGEVPVKGLTASQVATKVATELQQRQKLNDIPSATTEIVIFRPFYVLGDVQSPGAFPFKPGLTVMQAVSVAGGYYRLVDVASLRLERDAIAAKGDIDVLQTRMKQLLARQIRLAAEQSGAKDLVFPSEWSKLDSTSPEARLVAEERAIFATNNDSFEQRKSTFDRFHQIYEGEVTSIKAQIESEREQYRSVQDELASVTGLVAQGLTQKPRKQLLERTLAQVSGNIQGMNTLVLQAQQNISQTEQAKLDLQVQRAERINRDTQATRAEIDDTKAKIATAKRLTFEAQVATPDSLLRTTKGHFTIAKQGQGEATPANAGTRLEPGDVLTVERSHSPEPTEAAQN